jgi:hypothetical protein
MQESGRPGEKFCVVAPSICGPSVWTLLHVTLLTPRILRWLLVFWGGGGKLWITGLEEMLFVQTSESWFRNVRRCKKSRQNMVLGSTQPLTEMSTWDRSLGVKAAGACG